MSNVDRFFTKDAEAFADAYFDYVGNVLKRIDRKAVARFIDLFVDARERDVTVFFIGNGGSASTASHFACDIGIGPREFDPPFRALALTDNNAVITAIGNDFGYEDIFTRQLRILGRPGDVLVAISASGNSPNLVSAIEYAKSAGIKTFALTAFDGGKMKQIADDGIHVPTEPKEYGPAEDAHLILNHVAGNYLMRLVRQVAVAA
jgi:D-sedoheptulose 7-phosphate isomerase